MRQSSPDLMPMLEASKGKPNPDVHWDLKGNIIIVLDPGARGGWMQMKPDTWITCDAVTLTDKQPVFSFTATAKLYYDYDSPPIDDVEAVIGIFRN